MSVSCAKVMTNLLVLNHDIIHMQLKDITQAESMIQPPFRGNCLNWVVGHILSIYGEMLEKLDDEGTLSEAEQKAYGYGSEPLCDPARAGELKEMVNRLDSALLRITARLGSMPAEDFECEVTIWRGPMALIEALLVMQWHASYHTGQLELLRQLAGKNDKVI
jgi:hypothetical protein